MWRVYEYLTGKIQVFNQELLLIYLRKFNDGYVYYEEAITMQYDQRVIIEQGKVMTHSIEKVETMCEMTPHQRQQWNKLQ